MINLAPIRKKAGVSQREIKEKLGLSSTGTVSMWETGKRQPKADMLPKLAEILGCTVDELLRERVRKDE